MKELNSFTVERLEEIRNSFLDRIQESAPSIEEVFALIDIALAAKRAEPVIIFNEPDSLAYRNLIGNFPVGTKFYTTPPLLAEPVAWEVKGILCHSKEEADSYVGEPDPLYDVPQLNSPEVRKLILSEVSDFCAGLGQPGEPELPEDIQQALMNRIELVFNNCG